ncbi:MAG: DUF1501 domain-containing protein [Aestuariivirga sp.]|nr:DUF1501 domain-containing protein [Aestuariivirga sp.]
MSDNDHVTAPVSSRIIDAAADGCEESRLLLRRRDFMALSAGFFAWAFAPRIADAATGQQPRLLIVLLSGGVDGLHVAVPADDPAYAAARGAIALDRATMLPLFQPDQKPGKRFLLHRSLPKFHSMFQSGEASLVHAIAPPLHNRSHFDCMHNLQAGLPGGRPRSVTSGWLNRLMGVLPSSNPVRVGGALQVGPMPLILSGEQPVLGWTPTTETRWPNFNDQLLGLYRDTDTALHRHLSAGLAVSRIASQSTGQSLSTGNLTPLQTAFRGAARLLAADDGPRIAALNVMGWDTHVSQIQTITSLLSGFDTALDDFRIAIGGAWSNTVVVCVTEFGRTARINGTNGTDHGVGTVAFLAGGAVAGGKVHTDWPGLAPSQLIHHRDLRATIDTRSLFKGVLADHLGVARSLLDSQIFPQSRDVEPLRDLLKAPSATMRNANKAATAPTQPLATGIAQFRRETAVN